MYLDGWKKEIDALPGLETKQKSRVLLSRETQEGLRITSKCTTLTLQAQYSVPGIKFCFFPSPTYAVMSFTELAPKLLNDGLEYVLS